MSAIAKDIPASMSAGIYPDLPANEYHAGPGVSSTMLKDMLRSPLHCWARHLDPERPQSTPTPAMQLGSAVHTAVLEPERWDQDYAVAPRCDRRTKAGKETWAEFQASAGGRVVLTEDQAELVSRVAAATAEHPSAREMLEVGDAETSIFYDHPCGELVKVRPDWWARGQYLLDLKTTRNAGPGFARQIAQLNYHMQAAFYVDVVEAVRGETLPWYWLAVETEPPYAVGVYQADAEMLSRGRELYRQALSLYAVCRQTGQWPGYSEKAQVIRLPGWALHDEDRDFLDDPEF